MTWNVRICMYRFSYDLTLCSLENTLCCYIKKKSEYSIQYYRYFPWFSLYSWSEEHFHMPMSVTNISVLELLKAFHPPSFLLKLADWSNCSQGAMHSCSLTWQVTKHHTVFHSFTLFQWDGRKHEKKKKIELMGWDKLYLLTLTKENEIMFIPRSS